MVDEVLQVIGSLVEEGAPDRLLSGAQHAATREFLSKGALSRSADGSWGPRGNRFAIAARAERDGAGDRVPRGGGAVQ